MFFLWWFSLCWSRSSSKAKGSLAGGSSSSSLWRKMVWCCCHGILEVCFALVNPVWVFGRSALLSIGDLVVVDLPGLCLVCPLFWVVG